MIFQSLLPLNLGSVGMGQKEWRLIQIPKAKRINSHYLNGGKLAIPMFWIWNFGQTMKTDMDEMKWSSIDIYFSFLTYVLRKIKFILGINLQKKKKMEGVFIANYEVRFYIFGPIITLLPFSGQDRGPSNLANIIHRRRDTSTQFLQLNHTLSLFGEDALLMLTNTRGIS